MRPPSWGTLYPGLLESVLGIFHSLELSYILDSSSLGVAKMLGMRVWKNMGPLEVACWKSS